MRRSRPLNWLVGATLASLAVSYVAVRGIEYFWGGIAGAADGAAKATVFSGVWTGVTSALGMRAFTEKARAWRQDAMKARKRLGRQIDRHIDRL